MNFTFEPGDLDILQAIVEESSEHLNGIEEGILRLENDFEPELLDSIFRAMHSVKGVSSFADLVPINATAHSLESFLTDMKKGLYRVNSEITDALLRGVDIVNLMISQLGAQVQELVSTSCKDSFTVNIDDYGFNEFIKYIEELRSILSDPNQNSKQEPQPLDKSEAKAPEPKLELSSFLEQMLSEFFDETAEHLETIEQKCVDLEKYPGDPEILNSILRGFHSIKGAAGVISSMREQDQADDPVLVIKSLTHAVESLLQSFRNQSIKPSAELIDLILTAVDQVTILTRLVKENEVGDVPAAPLLERIEAMSQAIGGAQEGSGKTSETIASNLPHQTAAFINITGQAMDSMLDILKNAEKGQPINRKRIKQYSRALKNIASTARYLDYEEVVQMVESSLAHLAAYTPEKDIVSEGLISLVESDYHQLKQLLDIRINNIHEMLTNVPADYGNKRLGEILIAEKKVTPDQLNKALQQQKQLGTILVENGAVKQADMEIALARQSIAREKNQAMVQQAKTPTADTGVQSIRVSQEKLDYLMNMIGELLISKNRVFHLANKISSEYSMPALSREVKSIAGELARISDELQNSIMSVRMVPLRTLFQRYPRTIRDTARKAGKTVELFIEGEETELDKTVIEAINDPLVHMLRNAVDHGIEPAEMRQSLGKDPTGNILLKAFYQGNHVVIEIKDDGKGLNPDEIKLKALKKGLIKPEQIETLSNEEALQFIFAPGFSTRDEVSELSGRGVGMDVVKTNIEAVGGSVNMSSIINQGTTFNLKIPLSMSIIKGLIVESCEQHFIIPLDAIEETVKLEPAKIRRYKNQMVADIREQILPLLDLQNMLGIAPAADAKTNRNQIGNMVPVVIVAVDGMKCGIIVDRFQKEQEFVVKGLSEELAAIKIYTGATILGDGSVVLILNMTQLLHMHISSGNGG